MSGNTNDVGGRIFETSNKNTTSDSKILIPKVTWNIKSCFFFIFCLFHFNEVLIYWSNKKKMYETRERGKEGKTEQTNHWRIL